MKKAIILTLAIASVTTFASAQEFKPAAGSKTLEVQFAPLGGNPVSIGGLRFRSFSSETSAMRADIFIGFMSSTEVTQQKGQVIQPELKTKNSSFEIGLMPGIEKHFAGTDRLSPYWGAVLDLGWKSSSEKVEHQNSMSVSAADSLKVETTTTKGTDGFMRLGAGLVLGTDFYFAKKFYLGAECGLGLGFKKMSTIKVEESEVTNPVTPAAPDQKQGSEFNFGPTVNGKLRLGWNF